MANSALVPEITGCDREYLPGDRPHRGGVCLLDLAGNKTRTTRADGGAGVHLLDAGRSADAGEHADRHIEHLHQHVFTRS